MGLQTISSALGKLYSGGKIAEDNLVTGKEDDKKLLKKMESWWEDSNDLYTKRLEWVKSNRDFYLGKHIKFPRPTYKSCTVHNKIFENVDSFEEKMTKNLPEPVVAIDMADEVLVKAAKTVNNALLYLHRLDKMQLKCEIIARNMLLDRDAIAYMRWNKNKGKEGSIEVEVVEAENVRISPNSTPFDISDFFFIAPPRTYKEVLEQFPDERDHILESFGVSEEEVAEDKKADTLLPLKDCWYWAYDEKDKEFNINHCVYLKDKILIKEKNPYWDFEGELREEDKAEFAEEMKRIKQMAVMEGKEKAKTELDRIKEEFNKRKKYRNYFECQEFPLVIFPTFVDNRSPFSHTGFIEQVKSLQVSLNERKQEIDENCKLVGKGQIVMDKNCGIPHNTITNVAGAIFKKNPGTEFRKEQGVPLPEQYFNDMKDTEMTIDNVFGANSISKGEQSASITATEATMIKETDQGRVGKIIRKFEFSMEKVYQWQVHMMKLFYTKPRMIGIANNVGDIESFETITNDDIPDNLQIFVKVGSAQPIDMNTRRAENRELFRQGLIDSITYFERDGQTKDPYEAAERLWKEKNNMLFEQPNVGPEQRAREFLDMVLNNQAKKEDLSPDPEATLESTQILAEAIQNSSKYPFTEEQIMMVEQKLQAELEQIKGAKQEDRAKTNASKVPLDIAAGSPEIPEAAQALEMGAEQEM